MRSKADETLVIVEIALLFYQWIFKKSRQPCNAQPIQAIDSFQTVKTHFYVARPKLLQQSLSSGMSNNCNNESSQSGVSLACIGCALQQGSHGFSCSQ